MAFRFRLFGERFPAWPRGHTYISECLHIGTRGEEQRAKSKGRRAKGEEQRAKSKGRRAKGEEQRAKSKGRRAKGEGRRAKGKEQSGRGRVLPLSSLLFALCY